LKLSANPGSSCGFPDVNECEGATLICGDSENCINVQGSYECICKSGFKKVDGLCVGV